MTTECSSKLEMIDSGIQHAKMAALRNEVEDEIFSYTNWKLLNMAPQYGYNAYRLRSSSSSA